MQTLIKQVDQDATLLISSSEVEAMGLRAGERVKVRLEPESPMLEDRRAALLRAQEAVRSFIDPQRSLVDELIAERRLEAGSDSVSLA
jgi:hypothetical protein